ncbi:GGDEF domain-containing protein [Butyrivibrio sp. VCB2006]|uniref:GGDEF domain-containing protein n=1 Tax=Butyrivibrio sp. VCB2006 TaxID=1280679 RepID=UPI0004157D21|nr:GGDEF domain-containing protein [Butyrivibrio sp. VCB2006]
MQESNKQTGINKILNRIFAAVVILLFVIALFFSDAFSRSYLPEMTDYNDEWLDENGNSYKISSLNVKDHGGKIVLTKKLPYYIFDGDCLCFESRNVNIKVMMGKRRIYDFNTEENITGMGYGIAFHNVGISREDGGEIITLEFDQLINNEMSGQLFRVYLGKPADYIRRFIYDRALLVIASVLIIFFGLLLVILWLGIPDKSRQPFDVIALGIASFCVGMWCLINTSVIQLLSGHYYFWRIIGTLLIPMIGYPFVVFFVSLTVLKKKIYNILAFVVSVGAEVGMILLRYVANIDMMNSLVYFSLFVAASDLIIMIIYSVENRMHCKSLDRPTGLKNFDIGIGILIALTVLDVLMWGEENKLEDSYGAFMRFGIVVFIIIMILQFVSWWTRDQADMDRERFINRSLQFSATSRNPVESIKLLLEYLGKELQAKRTYIFEGEKNGAMQATYEWYADGLTPMDQEIESIPSEKEIEKLHECIMTAENNCFIIRNAEEIKDLSPFMYSMMEMGNLSNAVFSPLVLGNKPIGFVGIADIPKESINNVYEIMGVLPYFFAQMINQRKEQDRIIYYSYHDSLSGAKNRTALKEFMKEKLDVSQAFGYVLCEIDDLKEINANLGHDAGDAMVQNTAKSMMEAFGEENVYRLSGENFVAFGFENDETYFENDVLRAKRLLHERKCLATVASVFCSNGANDIEVVIKHTFELLENEKVEQDKGV